MDDETLTERLCQILGALPSFAYRPDDNDPLPTADEIGVFYGRIADAPDRAVGVRVYGALDDRYLQRRRVQVWIRGGRRDPAGADRIAGVIFRRLDKLSREGGINGIRRESVAALGADDNDREQRSENYLITLDNEEALQ